MIDSVYYAKGSLVRDGAELDIDGYVCMRGEEVSLLYGDLPEVTEALETSSRQILGRAPPNALHFLCFIPSEPVFDHLFVLNQAQSVDGDPYAGLYLGTYERIAPQKHVGEEDTLGVLELLVATHHEGLRCSSC